MTPPPLGVVLVAYNSADVILDCLETLVAAAMADGTVLRVVVVDNASPDDSVAAIRAWAVGARPYKPPADLPFAHRPVPKPLPEGVVENISAGMNGGFAAGVNIGLRHLFGDPAIDRVWILNPDSAVPPGTPAAFARHDPGPFALMGGRVVYYDHPEQIQIDGGTINRWTGVTGNLNLCAPYPQTRPPRAEEMQFITGASMVASRQFIERAGPMPEDYFLYYEEVDWALRRGDLPLVLCQEAIVYHRAGTSIGSPTIGRPASPFSLYFKHRGRMRFVRRYFPWALPVALLYSFAKAAQLMLKGYGPEGATLLRASLGFGPDPTLRASLSPKAADRAFAAWKP